MWTTVLPRQPAEMRTTFTNYCEDDGDGKRSHGNTVVIGLSQTVFAITGAHFTNTNGAYTGSYVLIKSSLTASWPTHWGNTNCQKESASPCAKRPFARLLTNECS